MDNIQILLIDDDIVLGELIADRLWRLGFAVDWFVRAARTNRTVVLTDPDGKLVTLSCQPYDVALVDGRLKGSPLDGWELTPVLVKMGLPVVALSGLEVFNREMIAAGASGGIVKDQLWCSTAKDGPSPRDILLAAARSKTA